MAKLLWSDEFTSLDLVTPVNPKGRWRANDTWQGDKGYVDFGSGGSWCANPSEVINGTKYNPFSIKDGVLTITSQRTTNANRAAMGGVGWWGGILISNTDRADMTFGYGYYEFKAQWPNKGKGMFPALWFFAANGQNNGANKGHAEIDLLEIFGYPAGAPWSITLHEKDNNGGGSQYPVYAQRDDTTDWHTYGVDWAADRLNFYKDRQLVASMSGSHAQYFAGTRMSIRLNYAMDASWFSGDQKSDNSTPSPLIMNVDYVRQYDSVPSVSDTGNPPVVPPVTPVNPSPTPTPAPSAPVPPPPSTPKPVNTATGITVNSPAPTSKPANDQQVNLPVVWPHYGFSDNILRALAALLSVRGVPTTGSDTWTTQLTASVRTFQSNKGLPVTGVVDAGTWARLIYG